MISITQYLRMELADRTEPAGFYIPGATDWNDPTIAAIKARIARAIIEDLRAITESEEWEE